MAQPREIPVVLLKTQSSPADGYYEVFSNEGYKPCFVPVLEHVFASTGLEFLEAHINDGAFASRTLSQSENRYGGLIFTSQRAVEAFSQVILDMRKDGTQVNDLFAQHLPIYVVGPATAKGLRALNLPCTVFGEHTGNGEALADFILEHYNQLQTDQVVSTSSDKLGLLFVVGEQRRDIIPRTLQSESLPPKERIPIKEITVYETAIMQSFAEDFASVVQYNMRDGAVQWFVVFSPTGCQAMLKGLGLLDPTSGKINENAKDPKRRVFIATIGPTTRNYLLREFDFEPDVCSTTPSPEGLRSSIAHFESRYPDIFAE